MMCSDDDADVFLGISKGTLPHDLLVNELCSNKLASDLRQV
jgi:hypothetical protein